MYSIILILIVPKHTYNVCFPLSQPHMFKCFQSTLDQPEDQLRIVSPFSKKLGRFTQHHSRPLFRLFSVFFKQTIQFLQQIYVKKCPSSIRCRDSNPRPLECESPPITTRPGLPPRLLPIKVRVLMCCCKTTAIKLWQIHCFWHKMSLHLLIFIIKMKMT